MFCKYQHDLHLDLLPKSAGCAALAMNDPALSCTGQFRLLTMPLEKLWHYISERRLCAVQYATRVRTIKNDVSRNEVSKDVVKLRQQVRHTCHPMSMTVFHCGTPWTILRDAARTPPPPVLAVVCAHTPKCTRECSNCVALAMCRWSTGRSVPG